MAECLPKLKKPKMRGLLQKQVRTNLCVAICLSIISGLAFKHFVGDARKKKYADFYRNYDPEKDFLEMLKQGADFQSVQY